MLRVTKPWGNSTIAQPRLHTAPGLVAPDDRHRALYGFCPPMVLALRSRSWRTCPSLVASGSSPVWLRRRTSWYAVAPRDETGLGDRGKRVPSMESHGRSTRRLSPTSAGLPDQPPASRTPERRRLKQRLSPGLCARHPRIRANCSVARQDRPRLFTRATPRNANNTSHDCYTSRWT